MAKKTAYKDSVTGKFVSEAYAKANPATTFKATLHEKPKDSE